jgi:hypothetical protein
MNNIFKFKIKQDYSVTTKNVNLMPAYTPLNNQQRNTGIIFHKTEDEIKELKTSKIFKTGELEYRISSIAMDCKTDESILYALLSQNKEEFSISIKDLAIQIGVDKRQATAKKVKERIMNSINKHRCFDFTLLKGGIFHTGFSILSYTFDMPQKDHLTIYFDKQFLNLYKSSNQSIINLKKYLELKSEYSKLIYSMINNFFNKNNNEITIYPEVFRKRLNNINEEGKTFKITAQQRQKINTGLEELKKLEILKTFRFNKNDSLVFKINKDILNNIKIEDVNMETTTINVLEMKSKIKSSKGIVEYDLTSEIDKTNKHEVSNMIDSLKKQLKITKSPLEYHCIEENIKSLENELKEEVKKVEIKKEVKESENKIDYIQKEVEQLLNGMDAEMFFSNLNKTKKITK